jgi:uncharacterized protein YeaO (DUF488 family)
MGGNIKSPYTYGMAIRIKRIYDKAAKTDGPRVLVDRLWPRGITKAEARVTSWAKELAPSGELRKWFHEDREGRFKEFERRYRAELRAKKAAIRAQMKEYGGSYTLLTAAKDTEHSHVPVLAAFLRKI